MRQSDSMKIIGITGGVGAGKSQILSYLQTTYGARVLAADAAANALKQPGQCCYQPIVSLLGEDILTQEGLIDNGKMAAAVFADKEKLAAVNRIVHPAVREYILREIKRARREGAAYFFLEAALLIEEHYDEVVDEMWYIDTSDEIRRRRLRDSRGYTDEKITAIMKSQLPRTAFCDACDFVIDNSHTFEETKKQIDRKMGEM